MAKKVKRLDKSIHQLLMFLRDKTVERIIKLKMGKSVDNVIISRHRSAMVSTFIISKDDSNTFTVEDPKNNTYYCVEKQNVNCCSIKCSFCHICIHSYKCSCVDFLIRTVICKHIHYIAMQGDNINIQVCPSTSHTGNENSTEVQKLVSCISKRQDSDTLKEQIRVKALSVIEGLESGELSNEQLKLMLQHQNAVLSVSNINMNKFDVENSKISTEPQIIIFPNNLHSFLQKRRS